MKVSVLGTAPPLLTIRAGHAGTGLLVEAADTKIMLDCGPGVVSQLDTLGVDLRQVDTLVITHHHWDHIADLAFFVLGRWEASQFGAADGKPFAEPLTIYGPSGTDAVLEKLLGADGVYVGDIATRLAPDIGIPLYSARGVRPPFPPIIPEVRVLSPGDTMTIGSIRMEAALASHCEPYLESLAYRLECDGKAVVFSGDTAPCEGVRKLARNADLLLHDCNIPQSVRSGLGRVSTHSTATEVGAIASEANVKHVVAVHHGRRSGDREGRQMLLDAISSNFQGAITIASELQQFEV